MKIIFAVLIGIFAIFPSYTFAEDSSYIQSVFLLESHNYYEYEDLYDIYSYGSAVRIADDLLLTNAHVVLDDY